MAEPSEADVLKRVSKLVYEKFYPGPIAGSKERLARALIEEFGLENLPPKED